MDITSENDNGYKVMIKWRYEDSANKLIVLKKKIQQLKDIVNKDQKELKVYKKSYEKLFNFTGDGKALINAWGLSVVMNQSMIDVQLDNTINTVEDSIASPEVKPKMAKEVRKKPLAKASRHNSRSSSQIDDNLT